MIHYGERSPKVLSQSQLTEHSQAPVTSCQLLLIPFSFSFSCEIHIFIL